MSAKILEILIAEDDILLSIGIESVVEKLGHRIIATCSSGEELRKKVVLHKPDLIIADISLNDRISGIEAVKDILPRLPDISVIYITADSDSELKKRASKATGFIDYLTKPIDLDRLKKAISSI